MRPFLTQIIDFPTRNGISINQHNVIVDVQHGFREKRSCESQLLITINDFAKALNDGKQMDTVLLDFSKAFDKKDIVNFVLNYLTAVSK